MGFFRKLTKLTLDVATTPVSVAKDVATMGGLLTDRMETYTGEKLRRIQRDGEELMESLDD